MTEWWEGLSMLSRVLYCIAVPSTLILLLQTIFSVIGIGDDADINLSDTGGIDMYTEILLLCVCSPCRASWRFWRFSVGYPLLR